MGGGEEAQHHDASFPAVALVTVSLRLVGRGGGGAKKRGGSLPEEHLSTLVSMVQRFAGAGPDTVCTAGSTGSIPPPPPRTHSLRR